MTLGWRTALFAAMPAAAGLPLYIHLPQFAATEMGLSLTAVGAILIGIRIFDLVQDPLLGWMVDRAPARRGQFAALSAFGLAIGFAMLFSVAPPIRADLWMTLALVILFTAYSLATILIYSQSVAIAEAGGAGGHFSIAGYREAGLIAGVVLAAIAPTVLAALGVAPYSGLGVLIAVVAVIAWSMTRPLWAIAPVALPRLRFAALREAGADYLLALAFANALPVALTSTLFLFFVGDRLGLPDQAGLFLILFFAAAGLSAPVWSALARRADPRRVLIAGMALAIVGFLGAGLLPPGASLGFAIICVVTGAAQGADMVILSALFAARLSAAGLPTGQTFGFWAFVSKGTLALAAIIVLPLLEARGYRPGGPNPQAAIDMLTFSYAVLPCVLKLAAVAMVVRLPSQEVAV